VLSGDEHVAEFKPPTNVVPMEKGRKMADLVASGELVAAIGVESDHPDVKPLIANAKETAFNALAESGHYPINHLMVVKDEILEAHPGLAPDLFRAFSESKRIYVDKLKAGAIEKPTAVDEMHKRVMEITGRDPLPYGIAPNRAALEEVIRSAQEQKILTKPVTVEALFPRNTHELVG
jgi:4,5-dihydroxyphthalate decarboxylase